MYLLKVTDLQLEKSNVFIIYCITLITIISRFFNTSVIYSKTFTLTSILTSLFNNVIVYVDYDHDKCISTRNFRDNKPDGCRETDGNDVRCCYGYGRS